MRLFHGTTGKRADQIFAERKISNYCDRFFTEEENGNGYTTQGYVYLTNELLFAVYFANCHSLVDKSRDLAIFRIEIPDELLEPDYDEIRFQSSTGRDITEYATELEYSLMELKTCRIPTSIEFDRFNMEFTFFNKSTYSNMPELLKNTGCNYKDTVENYNCVQRQFIRSLCWNKIVQF